MYVQVSNFACFAGIEELHPDAAAAWTNLYD
jgi:hypothetical protein